MSIPVTPPSPGWYPCTDGITRYWTGVAWVDPAPVPPAAQPPQYPGGSQQHPAPAQGITSPRARGMIALVGGILSVLFCTNLIYGLPVGMTGLALSLVTLKATPRGQHGRGLATAGLVLSIVGMALTLLIFIVGLLDP